MSDKGPTKSYASFYALLYPKLRELAYSMGYALAIHGSMVKDLDLLAVPWTADATEECLLVEEIGKASGGFFVPDKSGEMVGGKIAPSVVSKPHGRRVWTIAFGGDVYIDLSVMPRAYE